ncbi:MAG: hypothetical protein HEP71_24575 [Roseivirga sp.]|nr:hypothetical protein [Roseivirga sp.]
MRVLHILITLSFFSQLGWSQTTAIRSFNFDGTIESGTHKFEGGDFSFSNGLKARALKLNPESFSSLSLEGISLNNSEDFTLQFWVKTTSDQPMTFLSQKSFDNKGMSSQLNAGWALYTSGGTLAWNAGSGSRRLTYERDNGSKMPVNDGEWHQLAMTYSKALQEVRIYYDGHNQAIYKVKFDFANDHPLRIGTQQSDFNYKQEILDEIREGAAKLQTLVDAFNQIGVEKLQDREFISVVVEPKDLLEAKIKTINPAQSALIDRLRKIDLKSINDIRNELLSNHYTVHQVRELTEIKPIHKIYSLEDGRVVINTAAARDFTKQVQLSAADFEIDELMIYDSLLSAEEVFKAFKKVKKASAFKHRKKLKELTVGVWNIWHGGLHFTEEEHGWDSRMRIVEMIRELDVDILLMQETYSSGDYIAAELGYYFATSSDWDYRQQGSNISVLSRYPIESIEVPDGAEFMNVAALIKLSKSQQIYAMSNWYGMNQFPTVYDFHQGRFSQSDEIPVFFGGDFNAVPHTDGGNSPASKKLLDNGFTDAYRSLHPDFENDPAHTHNSGVRIDQLYYKGQTLQNASTEVVSDWQGGFPSDHYLILSRFKLKTGSN